MLKKMILAFVYLSKLLIFRQRFMSNRFPFIRQDDVMDCGPACLAMISKHWGNALPIHYWRERIKPDQSGASLFDLATALEHDHFSCHGFAVDNVEDIDEDCFPFIAHRLYHFVVVYNISNGYVEYGDPAHGIRKISTSEFQSGLEAVLFARPNEEFFTVKSSKRSYNFLFTILKNYKLEFLSILILSILISLVSLAHPFIFQFLLDEGITFGNVEIVQSAIGLMIMFALLNAVLSVLKLTTIEFISYRIDFFMGSSFIKKVFSLPFWWVNRKHHGDFSTRFNELFQIRSFFAEELINDLLDIVSLIIYLTILWSMSQTIFAVVAVSAPLIMLIPLSVTPKIQAYHSEYFMKQAESESLLVDFIKGFSTLKAFNSEVSSRWRFENIFIKKLTADYRSNLLSGWATTFTSFAYAVINAIVLYICIYLAITSDYTVGQTVSVVMIAQMAINPFLKLSYLWGRIIYLKVIVDRLGDIYNASSEDKNIRERNIRASSFEKISSFSFKDVSFKYGRASNEMILQNISMDICSGEHVAVVGPSGSGKSTLAMLATALLEPVNGTILLNGVDINDISRKDLRKKVCLLSQEPHLYHGTILENIVFNESKVDVEKLKIAAKSSDIEEIIAEKPEGFMFPLTFGGAGLSMGQKQRISLARILYRDLSVLFLDEATSSLDLASERRIVLELKNRWKHLAIVSIAHRFETVRLADRIVVIKDGKIVEQGTHDELKKYNGEYCKLFKGLI